MCGIVGYISSKKNAVSEAIKTLKKLEYRGYDSSGIAYFDNDNNIKIKKAKGKIKELEKKVDKKALSNCAIAHTRWATHGIANETNAHPHNGDKVILVQNGIIENYQEIKNNLMKKQVTFYSETDTEVITKLIDYEYLICKNPLKAIRKACQQVKGSYALLLMFKDVKNTLYAISNEAPLVITQNDKYGYVIASDVNSLAEYGSDKFWFLDAKEIAVIKHDDITFVNSDNKEFDKKPKHIMIKYNRNDKNGFDTYMLKEINEQTNILVDLINLHSENNEITFKCDNLDLQQFKDINHIRIIGCGTAYNSGFNAKTFFEEYANIKVEMIIASEFRYSHFIKEPNCLNIVISQSGETADTIASLRLLKQSNEQVLAIVNNETSTIANEANYVVKMRCGVEQAVASTKAYSSATLLLQLFACKLSIIKGLKMSSEIELINQAYQAIYQAHEVIDITNLNDVSQIIAKHKNIFFIGRGFNYALSCEAALKLKELTYLNCNAYPAGELKHGPISLIDNKTITIAIMATNNELLNEKTYSNIKEISARNGNIVCLSNNKQIIYLDDHDIHINNYASENKFSYLSTIYIFQLIAYYAAVALKKDVDNPRNLAKSVTVE